MTNPLVANIARDYVKEGGSQGVMAYVPPYGGTAYQENSPANYVLD